MGDYDNKKRDKLKSDKREESSGKLELSTNSRGEIEASIEETNRIRASLGLKPLKIEEKKDTEKEKKKNASDRKTAEIADQISQLKKKRIANKVIGKSLGEMLEEEEESAANWVNKARVVQEEQIKKEKELAMQRALELEARDKEIEHTSADLKGLKVAHNFENFQDIGEGVILTLKDSSILKDNNSLNEEEADLENIKISEKERLKKYIEMKKKKVVYNAYDEDTNKSILPQYDEEKKESAGFIISNNGKLMGQNQLDEIRNKLNNKDKDKSLLPQISLDSNKLLASEYLTPQEESAIKFKKSNGTTTKKKKKLRKKALDELVPEESSNDRGSRSDSIKLKAEEQKEAIESEKRNKSYQKAINKAQSSLNKGEQGIVEEELEEEDISAVIKAKQLASAKKKESEDAIMQRVQLAAKQREQQQQQSSNEDKSLIFTSTTEFVRAIQPLESIPQAPASASTPTSNERDKEIMEDIEDHEKMLQQANKKRKQRENEESNKVVPMEEEQVQIKKEDKEVEKKEEEEEEEEETTPFEVLEDHTRSGGMSAILRMLQHKKPSDDLMWAGRRTDEKPAGAITGAKGDDPAPHIKLEYRDEFGRIRTPKEEFRALSHRFHGKMPGKNKQEKRQKQYEEDMKKLQVLNESTSVVQSMQAEQEKRATPYLVLGASIKSLTSETASGQLSKLNPPPVKKSDSTNKSTNEDSNTDNNNKDNSNVIQSNIKGGMMKGEFKEFKIEKKPKLQ